MVSWKAGVVLLALLVVLGYFLLRPQPKPAEPPKLVPCDSFNTVYARFEGGGKVTEIERPKLGDSWSVKQPVSGAADRTSVEYDVNSINSIKIVNTVDRPGDLAQYGLDKPHVAVTCRLGSGASYNLTVGGKSFDGSAYYAQKQGDPKVYVISAVEVDGFDRTLSEPPIKPSPQPGASQSPAMP